MHENQKYLNPKNFKKDCKVADIKEFIDHILCSYYWLENKEHVEAFIRSREELLSIPTRELIDLFERFEVFCALRVPRDCGYGRHASWGDIYYEHISFPISGSETIQSLTIVPDRHNRTWVKKLAKCISLITEDMINAIDDVGDDA